MFALKRIATPLRSFAMTQQMLMSRVAGTVKFFDSVKGFGFIAPADASADVFVHQSNIKSNGFRSLGEGEKVEFKVETSEDTGKRYAVEVTGPGGAEPKGAPRRSPGGGGERRGGGGGGFDGERRPRRNSGDRM